VQPMRSKMCCFREKISFEKTMKGATTTDLAHSVAELVTRVASLEAEGVGAHEVVPLDDLLVSRSGGGGSVGSRGAAEGVREDETTERVTALVGTVGVL
jgi:hypothetical protein